MKRIFVLVVVVTAVVWVQPALTIASESARSAEQVGPRQVKLDVNYPLSERAAVTEGFEGGVVPPAGWLNYQTNAAETWGIDTFAPHSGSFYATCLYDPALNAQEELLYSPAISGTTGFLVRFFSQGSIYWCRDTFDNCDLNIYLDTDTTWGNGSETLVYTADGDWPDNFVWQQSTVDLSSYADGTPYYVVFSYTGTDGAAVSIDDIELLTDDDLPIVGCGDDQTVLEEHFETWPPAGWQIVNSGGDCDWDSTANISATNLTGGTGAAAIADSDACGSGTTMNTELWTPVMDLTGFTSAEIKANAYLNVFSGGGETFTIDVSDDGGTNWTNLLTWIDDQSGQEVAFDLTPFATANVVVRFTYDSPDWNWDAQVDDVYVCGVAAVQPPPDAVPTLNEFGIGAMLLATIGVGLLLLRRRG